MLIYNLLVFSNFKGLCFELWIFSSSLLAKYSVEILVAIQFWQYKRERERPGVSQNWSHLGLCWVNNNVWPCFFSNGKVFFDANLNKKKLLLLQLHTSSEPKTMTWHISREGSCMVEAVYNIQTIHNFCDIVMPFYLLCLRVCPRDCICVCTYTYMRYNFFFILFCQLHSLSFQRWWYRYTFEKKTNRGEGCQRCFFSISFC